MDPLDALLEPGEAPRLELRPSGWPPLTCLDAFLYGVLLFFFVAVIGEATMRWTVGAKAYDFPVIVPCLTSLALLELFRVVLFRARRYVVTDRRVIALSGVIRTRLRDQIRIERVNRIFVLNGDPVLKASGETMALPGAGEGLSALRELVPNGAFDAATNVPRSRARFAALMLAMVLPAASIEGHAVARRRVQENGQAFINGVQGAIAAANASIMISIERPDGRTRTRVAEDRSSIGFAGVYTMDRGVSLHSWTGASSTEHVGVLIHADHPQSLVGGCPTLEITTHGKPDDARWVETFRRECDAAGLFITRIDGRTFDR